MLIYNNLIKEAFNKSCIKNGYRYIPGQIKFCYFVWNLSHPGNRKIKGDGYLIHHKDENKLNDDRKNLEKVTKIEHNRMHKSGKNNPMHGRVGELAPMYGIHMCGENHPFFGKHHSPETIEKIRRAKKGKHHSLESIEKIRDAAKEVWRLRKYA